MVAVASAAGSASARSLPRVFMRVRPGASDPLRFGLVDGSDGRDDGNLHSPDAHSQRRDDRADRQASRDRHGDNRPLGERPNGSRVAVLGQCGFHEADRTRTVTPLIPA
jgi:hypothetical protein